MFIKLFVGNILELCSEDDFKEVFEKYGIIVEYVIVWNYVFVYFENKEDVENVIKELYEMELKGNVIRVLMLIILYKKGRGGGEGRSLYLRDRVLGNFWGFFWGGGGGGYYFFERSCYYIYYCEYYR